MPQQVLRDRLTVIGVAERYGVSRQAVHGWLRRYRTGGLDALANRSHRPRRCPHQMPAAVEAHLCELRRHHPGWGQRRLAHELARVGIDPPPGLTSIYRFESPRDQGKRSSLMLGQLGEQICMNRVPSWREASGSS